jgi:hypothetical protein
MQHGQHDVQRGPLLGRVHINRYAAAVVQNRHLIVPVDCYGYLVAEPGQGLVHRVVHHLVNQVMQTPDPDVADVHRGPVPDSFKAF